MSGSTAAIPQTGVWFFPDRPGPELVQLAAAAEVAGIDEFWIGDEGPAREPFSILSAAAMATTRITLAIGITNPYVRTPALAATTALTVHELSGGRMILGVGAGGQLSLGPFGMNAVKPLSQVKSFISTARAAIERVAGPNYFPTELAIDTPDIEPRLPVFVGARGRRLNELASEVADGAFVAGLPPARFEEVIGWARSHRRIAIALYPGVAFDEETVDLQRPQMIWGLIDTPQEVRNRYGLELASLKEAAAALVNGDNRPARAIVTDDLVAELILVGDDKAVGRKLADLVRHHQPSSIGLALLPKDPWRDLESAASALAIMKQQLAAEGPTHWQA